MNFWHERFLDEEYVYGTAPNAFLVEACGQIAIAGDVLAIAEGEGRNAVYLAERGLNVTAWDYAPSGLEKTRKLAIEKGVQVQTELVDLVEAEWYENDWDAIVCIFGHFPDAMRPQILQGIKAAVKPGGYYVTEVYSKSQLTYRSGGPKSIEMLYAPTEFLDIFADWRIIHFFMGEVERHEGDLHNGLAHVIQFIGQKPLE